MSFVPDDGPEPVTGLLYRQCWLCKDDNTWMVSWLPKRFAKVGHTLKLKGSDGVWVDGWVVFTVGTIDLTDSQVQMRSRDYLKTRKASDI